VAVADPRPDNSSPHVPTYRALRQLLQQDLDVVIRCHPSEGTLRHLQCSARGRKARAGRKATGRLRGRGTKAHRIKPAARPDTHVWLSCETQSRGLRCTAAAWGERVRRIDAVFQEDVLNFHEPGSWVFAEGALRDSGVNAISILVSLTAE
jgi:hypothetical protein